MSQKKSPATYLFVFRYPKNEAALSPGEMQQVFERWRVWLGKIRANGQYVAGDPLEDQPLRVLRAPRRRRATDGPFAEAKEVVAGYVLITAKNFAAAVAVARGCPALKLPGRSVEVRQVSPMDGRLHSA
jgi:hypothetical protein